MPAAFPKGSPLEKWMEVRRRVSHAAIGVGHLRLRQVVAEGGEDHAVQAFGGDSGLSGSGGADA
jgi:hypothetical protein